MMSTTTPSVIKKYTPPNRSFSHNCTSLISEFQHSSLRRSSSITRQTTMENGNGIFLFPASSSSCKALGSVSLAFQSPHFKNIRSLNVPSRTSTKGITSMKVWNNVGRRARTYGWVMMNGTRPTRRQASRIGKRGRWTMNKRGKKESARSTRMWAV